MKFFELFAGAGGLSLGLERAGLECVGHAEIEPHARAVLRHRWPSVPLYGDVTEINGADLMNANPFDLLTGGSPCQDLSVAGKRAGLSGGRSSLFYEQVRIWNESKATYLLWENVYGALSSNKGEDFARVLSALVGGTVAVPRDGWKRGGVASGPSAVAAWRVLDLQHVPGRDWPAPPQRRVRVFVLAARAGGVDPAEILALSEGLCRYPATCESPREATTRRAACGVGSGGVVPIQEVGKRTGVSTTDPRAGIGIGQVGDPMYTLQANAQHAIGFNNDSRAEAVVDGVAPLRGGARAAAGVLTFKERGRLGGYSVEVRDDGVVNALMTPNGGRGGTGAGDAVLVNGACDEVIRTLTVGGRDKGAGDSTDNTPVIIDHAVAFAENQRGTVFLSDVVNPITSGGGKPGQGYPAVLAWDDECNASSKRIGTLVRPPEAGGMRRAGVLAFHHTQEPITGDVSPSLGASTDGIGVLVHDAYNQTTDTLRSNMDSASGYGAVICTTGQVTHALTHEGADASEDGTGRGTPIVVARMQAFGQYEIDGTASAIKARDHKDATDIVLNTRPRRLTPLECERLMAWPDQHTARGVDDQGREYELSDTARYRLCGNGVGSTQTEWIGRRLIEMERSCSN